MVKLLLRMYDELICFILPNNCYTSKHSVVWCLSCTAFSLPSSKSSKTSVFHELLGNLTARLYIYALLSFSVISLKQFQRLIAG